MFEGFPVSMIPFLLDIRFNNNKAFMTEHHDEYIARVRDPFYAFIDALAPTMKGIDPDMEVRPAKCLSRIYRDLRFSKDKSPYRDHHWLAFRREAEQKDGALFFWFEIRIEEVNWGLGFWGENKEAMAAFRRRIAARPDCLVSLLPGIAARDFAPGGSEQKKLELPEGLPGELETWYRRRELYVQKQNVHADWIYSPDIVSRVAEDFVALKPLYKLLRGEENAC